jgi:hypothetical protein
VLPPAREEPREDRQGAERDWEVERPLSKAARGKLRTQVGGDARPSAARDQSLPKKRYRDRKIDHPEAGTPLKIGELAHEFRIDALGTNQCGFL